MIKQRKQSGRKLDIYYYSITGNTRSFAERFTHLSNVYRIPISENYPTQEFIVFTPTYNFGEVPAPVSRFLEKYSEYLVGVVAFGNRNWGGYYAKAGELIAKKFNVPLLKRIELRGTDKDYEFIKELLR